MRPEVSFIDTFVQHVLVMAKLLHILRVNAKIMLKAVQKRVRSGAHYWGTWVHSTRLFFHTQASRQ